MDLLNEIERFLAVTGMKPGTFGNRAVNDGKLVKRLRAGNSVTLKTAAKVQAFIGAKTKSPAERHTPAHAEVRP